MLNPLKYKWPVTCLAPVALAVIAFGQDAPSLPDFLEANCIDCHDSQHKRGGLNLEPFQSEAVTSHPEIWEKVIRRLDARQMPPPDEERPDEATYVAKVAELTAYLDTAANEKPNPGRTDSVRRLTRTEYRNAIRDLLGLDIDVAELLPKDESSHGFDNITVGTLSPTLLNRYISAAQKISRAVVGGHQGTLLGRIIRIPADQTQEAHVEGLPLGTRGGALVPHTFPVAGEYEIEIRLARDRNEIVEGLNGRHELELLLDRRVAGQFTVEPPRAGGDAGKVDAHLKTRVSVSGGPCEIGVTFVNQSSSLQETKRQPYDAHFNMHRHPRLTPAVYQISITGPFEQQPGADTPSRRRLFHRMPASAADEETCAREILGRIMRTAYRRPVREDDFARPLEFFREARAKDGFEQGIEMALSAILVSPRFLFRVEEDPAGLATGSVYPLDDLALASRLSFFLWSSLPDAELLDLAARGDLHQPAILEAQTRRMLADPKASSLITNFADQWLHLRNLESASPDLRLFPDFDDNLRQAFRKETELLFDSVLREDRSVLDLIRTDETFLNERLAKHYGIPHIYGSHFRKVKLDVNSHRGGILRHGSILTVTSYANRTSPVIRGNWILANILGTPTPPPPPDIPALDESVISAGLPMRDRLAAHRADRACSVCHNLMDPVGFSLENFDAVGRWRDLVEGRPIDSSGGLPDGKSFTGNEALENGLLERPDLFARTVTEKLLTYALGRGVEYFDSSAVRKIVTSSKLSDYRISSIIVGIVQSVPFTLKKTL